MFQSLLIDAYCVITCSCAIYFWSPLCTLQVSYALYCYSMKGKLIATMLCFLHVKQTNVFQCMLFMILVCSLTCYMHNYNVLLLELHLSCTCLEFFDPIFQCLQMVWS